MLQGGKASTYTALGMTKTIIKTTTITNKHTESRVTTMATRGSTKVAK